MSEPVQQVQAVPIPRRRMVELVPVAAEVAAILDSRKVAVQELGLLIQLVEYSMKFENR